MQGLRDHGWTAGLTLGLLAILYFGFPFVEHGLRFGWAGLTQDLTGQSRLYSDIAPANLGMFAHMIGGAVITFLAPLQLLPSLRHRLPGLHRWSGRILVVCACVAGLGGLAYIALRGTVGGWQMSLAFASYGMVVLICAFQTIRTARARRWQAHQDWAIRMFFMAIASGLYRTHYAIWFAIMGRTGVQSDFRGWFDQINIWAFFVPYLIAIELWLWSQRRGLLWDIVKGKTHGQHV